jgi:hypothetical protein
MSSTASTAASQPDAICATSSRMVGARPTHQTSIRCCGSRRGCRSRLYRDANVVVTKSASLRSFHSEYELTVPLWSARTFIHAAGTVMPPQR